MRFQGKITAWKDEQGFGFISPNGGGKQVYLHIKEFTGYCKRPKGDELVTYKLITDTKGRAAASEVLYVGSRRKNPLSLDQSIIPVYLTLAFLSIICVAVSVNRLSPNVLLIYAITSLVTFIFYWLDKRAAKNNSQRTSETTLQSLSLIGGWPGALLAQRIFRHKTSKKSFRITFWIQVFLNIIGLLIITSSTINTIIGFA
ncbi:MAG: DUF1294 domain-containing protein [Methylotenera sp.]|uniref:DUF1294 domain-containing protein n=1 Tax=Methylotenera sp. TaxID=2051956 RepID=UPI0024871F55|nr:DUF1294 domain-containing protein [Methylotenera sp.]MDI1307957.1 DUF1294 domain-containing protein [Methylotenera sp.]